MVLTVLGKYGPYPDADGGTSSYLVEGGGAKVMLDFGACALSRLQNYISLSELDGIVLSHLHNDHFCDLLPLSYKLSNAHNKLNLYLPGNECPQYNFILKLEGFNFIPVFPLRDIRLKNLSMTFYSMTHTMESYAVKLKSEEGALFYSGDTSFNDKIMTFAKGSDLLLLDCAAPSSRKNIPHMTIAEGAFIQKTLGIKTLATHECPDFPIRAEARQNGVELVEERSRYRIVKH